ncbi:MAG: hypothetical protein GXO79_01595 [Chlorobi bacterium]|nr:hypothetical protein [Chlorobiota bacterium]
MNNFIKNSNSKIYLWIIIILLIFNVSTIGTIFYHNYMRRKCELMNKPFPPPPQFLRHNPHFKDFHANKHHKFLNQYKTEAKEITMQLHDKRIELLNALSADTADTIYLHQLADEFGILHKDLKMLTIDFYLKNKAISTPDEQKELYHYLKFILNKDDYRKSMKLDSNFRKRKLYRER